MTLKITDNLPLLATLLAQGTQSAATQSIAKRKDGLFAGRLDHALQSSDPAPATTRNTAQALAETLSLQMLQTTLSLGENSADQTPQLFNRQSPQFQNLVNAYASNQSDTDLKSSSLPDKPSQLQDLAETPVAVSHAIATISPQGTQGLEAIIAKASLRYGVDSGLIKAVIKAESGFNPNAVSHAGAQGLMQLMPGTARALGVQNSFDPEQNVMAGTRFLHDLLKRYNGNLDSALAAYNWGPGNVDRKPEQLPRETREYLVRVKQLYSSYTA